MTELNLDVIVPKEVEDTIRLSVQATIDLSKLPDNVKRPIILALRRGHTTALSGKPVWYYSALAATYEFPIFQLGRTDRCIISYPRNQEDSWVESLVEDLKAMYKLTMTAEERQRASHGYGWWFRNWSYDSAVAGYKELVVTRPPQLTMESICTFMGVASLKELVPLDRRMAALLAVEQGQTVDISRFVRGVPK